MMEERTIILDERGNPVSEDQDDDDKAIIQMSGDRPANLIVVPLDEHVLFPGMTLPMVLGTDRAKEAIEFAMSQNHFIALVPRLEPVDDDDPPPPSPEELLDTGVLARVLKMLNLPDGNRSVVVDCVARCRVERYVRVKPFLIAKATYPADTYDETLENRAMRSWAG